MGGMLESATMLKYAQSYLASDTTQFMYICITSIGGHVWFSTWLPLSERIRLYSGLDPDHRKNYSNSNASCIALHSFFAHITMHRLQRNEKSWWSTGHRYKITTFTWNCTRTRQSWKLLILRSAANARILGTTLAIYPNTITSDTAWNLINFCDGSSQGILNYMEPHFKLAFKVLGRNELQQLR